MDARSGMDAGGGCHMGVLCRPVRLGHFTGNLVVLLALLLHFNLTVFLLMVVHWLTLFLCISVQSAVRPCVVQASWPDVGGRPPGPWLAVVCYPAPMDYYTILFRNVVLLELMLVRGRVLPGVGMIPLALLRLLFLADFVVHVVPGGLG